MKRKEAQKLPLCPNRQKSWNQLKNRQTSWDPWDEGGPGAQGRAQHPAAESGNRDPLGRQVPREPGPSTDTWAVTDASVDVGRLRGGTSEFQSPWGPRPQGPGGCVSLAPCSPSRCARRTVGKTVLEPRREERKTNHLETGQRILSFSGRPALGEAEPDRPRGAKYLTAVRARPPVPPTVWRRGGEGLRAVKVTVRSGRQRLTKTQRASQAIERVPPPHPRPHNHIAQGLFTAVAHHIQPSRKKQETR